MSRPRILICNLSPLHLVKQPDTASMTVPDEHVYIYEEMGSVFEYTGRQTNQAPVKCLLDRACHGDNEPVTMLINLYSLECELEHEPYINELGEEDARSDENYFIDSIVDYCESAGIPEFEPERIPYDPANPASSLAELISLLNQPNAIIDIDTTGGLRDASTLISLALQAIKERSNDMTRLGEIQLGRIVYSNFRDKTITVQKDTYALVDLANAIAAFTSYGKADLLCKYFEEREASGTTRALCANLKLFSDRLTLCNTDLYEPLQNIYALLSALEDTPNDGLTSSEVLFKTLLPTLRLGFIPQEENVTISLVKWCVERQMLQQALAIIREQMLDALVEEELVEMANGASSKDLEQLCYGKNRQNDQGKHYEFEFTTIIKPESLRPDKADNIRSCLIHPNTMVDPHYVKVKPSDEELLSKSLICFRYIWIVRNRIMHSSDNDDTWACNQVLKAARERNLRFEFLRVKSKQIKGKRRFSFDDKVQTTSNLTADLMLAVETFEGAQHARD